jgi:flagellar protein FliS
MNYQQQAMVGATGVELVVGLYDAAIRSLYRARQAVVEDDTFGRRFAVKKVTDILLYLQSRLRHDIGGSAASSLSDFYAAMFSMTLEASHIASSEGFDEVIHSVQNVRDAWAIVAVDSEAGKVLPRELRTREEDFIAGMPAPPPQPEPVAALRWSA